MADIRLDDLQAAFAAAPESSFGSAEPGKTPSSLNIPLDKLQLFDKQPEINRASYDLMYEKILLNATQSKIGALDFVAEPAANAVNFLPSVMNSAVLGVTGAAGEAVEAFSSREKFAQEFSELPIVRDLIDIGEIGADTMNLLFGAGTPEEKQAQSRALSNRHLTDREALKTQFSDPTAVNPQDFIPREGANVFEKTGKNLRALSFYGHANTKAFHQKLAEQADHPIMSQVGGAFGSITTSALLATVNPKLAMWAIGGHVGANFYLEQVSRGVDWKPSLGYAALIGTTVSALEQMSINLLFKKYGSRWALAGDSAVVNFAEEFSQSLAQAGIEQAIGAEDRTLGEVFKEATFEGAIGFIGGGIAGATTVQMAYDRMDRKLIELEMPKEKRHLVIMRAMAEGNSIIENVLADGLGADQVDFDLVNNAAAGEGNVNEALVELNRRMNERFDANGVNDFQESDPDALIEEQRIQDAKDDALANPDQTLTPDDKVEMGVISVIEPVSEAAALDEVANFIATLDATSQRIEDGEGNVVANVNPGFPEELKGYKTKEIDAVIKNVKSGKKLTAKQKEIKKALLKMAGDMGIDILQAATAPPDPERAVELSEIGVNDFEIVAGAEVEGVGQEFNLIHKPTGIQVKSFVNVASGERFLARFDDVKGILLKNLNLGIEQRAVAKARKSQPKKPDTIVVYRGEGSGFGQLAKGIGFTGDLEGIHVATDSSFAGLFGKPKRFKIAPKKVFDVVGERKTLKEIFPEVEFKGDEINLKKVQGVVSGEEQAKRLVARGFDAVRQSDAEGDEEIILIGEWVLEGDEYISKANEAEEPLTAGQQTIQDRELNILKAGRTKQINDELEVIAKEHDALNEDLEKRQEAGQPTHAVAKKLGLLNDKMEALLDEVELLPSAQREALANKIISVQAGKITALRTRAEVVAGNVVKQQITAQFRAKNADLKAARAELTKYIRDTFKGGLDIPKKFLTRVNTVTRNNIDKIMKEVDQARAELVRPHIIGMIKKTLGRVTSKIKGGRAAGALKSAALQDQADNLIKKAAIPSETANQLLEANQKKMADYTIAQGEQGAVAKEIDVDAVSREIELLQNVSGLDAKSEAELLASLEYIKGQVKRLKDGGRANQEILQKMREQERADIIEEMPEKVKRGSLKKLIKSFNNFTTNNLSGMLRKMIGDVPHVGGVLESTLLPKIDALEEAPRKRDSFLFFYTDALNKISARIYDLKNPKEVSDWESDMYSEGTGHDAVDVTFNNGKVGDLVLSKDEALYWYEVTHNPDGSEIPDMIEAFTGENAKQAAEEKAEAATEEAENERVTEDEDGNEIVSEPAKEVAPDYSTVKGLAIPIEHWNEMMDNIKKDPRNVEFVNNRRLLYNSVYALVNPVYRKYMGANLPRVQNYVPWLRDVGVEGDNFSALADFAEMVQTMGPHTMLRTPGATAAFKQVGSMQVFSGFIQEMAHFHAFALPMKDIISIIRNKEVRQAINERTDGVEMAGGTFRDGQFYSTLRKMADFVASRGKTINEMTLNAWSNIRTNLSVYYLGEPSKAVMQTSSMWMALTETDISFMDWVKGMDEFKNDPKAAFELMNKAPMMKFRYKHLMIEMKEAMDFIQQKDKTWFGAARKAIVPKSFAFVRAGNKIGAGVSGYVVMRKVFEETGDINEAFRRFDAHIKKTQQSADPTELSPNQIGQGNRITSQFQSAVIQYARIYGQAIDDWRIGRISFKDLAKKMAVFHILMPSMRWFLKALMRGGDFDGKRLFADFLMGPLAVGWILPETLEVAMALLFDIHMFGAETAVAGATNKATKSVRDLKKEMQKQAEDGEWDAFDLADAFIEAGGGVVSVASPVPIPGVAFDATQALLKAIEGEMSGLDLMSVGFGESPESLEFKKKKSNNTKSKALDAFR